MGVGVGVWVGVGVGTSSWPGHIMMVLERETAAMECSAVRCAEHCQRWCGVWLRGVRKEKCPPCPRTPYVTCGSGSRRPISQWHRLSKAWSTPQQVM